MHGLDPMMILLWLAGLGAGGLAIVGAVAYLGVYLWKRSRRR